MSHTATATHSRSQTLRLSFHQPLAPITGSALAQTGTLPHWFLLLRWPLCASIIIVSPLLCTWVIYFLTMTLCWLGKRVISEFYLSLPQSRSGLKHTIFCSHQSRYTTYTFCLIALYNMTLGLVHNMPVCKDSFVCAASFINVNITLSDRL